MRPPQPIRLVRVAAEAEALRWHGFAARTITRIVCGIVALVFVLGVLAIAHIAAWIALRDELGLAFYWATLAVGGFDLIVGLVLAFVASRSTTGRVEREAVEVRQRAVASLTTGRSLAMLAIPTLRFALARGRRR